MKSVLLKLALHYFRYESIKQILMSNKISENNMEAYMMKSNEHLELLIKKIGRSKPPVNIEQIAEIPKFTESNRDC